MYNFDPYNVLLAIATNIPVLLWLLLCSRVTYDDAKKNILCIWCNAMSLRGLRFKKHIIFHIPYIIVASLCPAFLKRVDYYKAHRSEKRGVLWLASYPVRCDWPNALSVWWNVKPLTICDPCWQNESEWANFQNVLFLIVFIAFKMI